MLPRTGSTLMGPFGFTPGIIPTPASEPLWSCAEIDTVVSATASATETASLTGIAGSLSYRRRLGRRGQRFQLFAVLGIHRFGTTASRLVRDAVVHAEFVEVRIRSGKQVRDHASRSIDFSDNAARIRRHLLMEVELVVGRSDERRGEVHGIRDDRGDRQKISMPHPVFHERRLVAAWKTIATKIALLQVRRGDREYVAIPFRGRKSSPRMQRPFGRMRPSIEVNHAIDRTEPLRMERGDGARRRIDFLRDSQV